MIGNPAHLPSWIQNWTCSGDRLLDSTYAGEFCRSRLSVWTSYNEDVTMFHRNSHVAVCRREMPNQKFYICRRRADPTRPNQARANSLNYTSLESFLDVETTHPAPSDQQRAQAARCLSSISAKLPSSPCRGPMKTAKFIELKVIRCYEISGVLARLCWGSGCRLSG